MKRVRGLALLSLIGVLALSAQAQAERALLTSEAVRAKEVPGGIEGACGIAFRSGLTYVSNYYHQAIDVFFSDGSFASQSVFDPPGAPCQLATSPAGALYVNRWHESVASLLPGALSFDSNESTGVAVDQATGNVYVNDRTYVAVYEPSGAAVLKEGQPLRIGEGTLGDAYGLAFSAGRLYVPDAADRTVKVYEPALDAVDPTLVIDGSASPQKGFRSLIDAAVAVDPTNSHLLVLDNLQPGFESPEAVLDEFASTGKFLGQVSQRLIDGEPSGLAFSGANLYATSGNSEGSAVMKFGPYTEGGSLKASEASPPSSFAQAASQGAGGSLSRAPSLDSLAQAVVVQRGGVRVSFDGRLAPRSLPRDRSAPVRVAVSTKIVPTDEGADPPQLRALSIAINRYGRFDTKGLPICEESEIQPATNANALAACREALVGAGSFSASVLLNQQAPFPAEGKVYAFNGRHNGRPAILAHVYGKRPVPTSFTLPFELKPTKGTYGTVLRATLPHVTGDSGYITGLSMNLGRNFSYRGERRSYLSASCPAPKGVGSAVFPLAHAGFDFKGGRSLGSTLVSSCGVR
jgi:DNA-binding beta-propeller fold protein YncE